VTKCLVYSYPRARCGVWIDGFQLDQYTEEYYVQLANESK
jgi:hypothetical protein